VAKEEAHPKVRYQVDIWAVVNFDANSHILGTKALEPNLRNEPSPGKGKMIKGTKGK